VIQNNFRKALAAESAGFPGVILEFGSIEGFTSDMIGPWWANDTGGSDNKTLAKSVAMTLLTPSATITMVVVPDDGFIGATPWYAKNNGSNTAYATGFTVVPSDTLKIGIQPLNQVTSGYGFVYVYANGTQVASVYFGYDPP
jgi:hypothetical protein